MFSFKRGNLSLGFMVRTNLHQGECDDHKRNALCSEQLSSLRTPLDGKSKRKEKHLWDHNRSDESGASLVEFTLIAPFLFMLLLGIMQYAYLMAAYVTVRSASAVGARAAVLDPMPTDSQIQATVVGSLGPLLDAGNLVTPIDVDTNYTIPGSMSAATKVSVTYNMPLFFSFVVPGTSDNGTIALNAVTIMR